MLTVAILNYNGKDIIEGCVETVLRQTNPPDEILLIDNQSTDNSWKLVENDVTRVVHADNKHRFITGLNTAFNEAKFGQVFFMENDVFLAPDCLEKIPYSRNTIFNPTFVGLDGHKYSAEKEGFFTAAFMMHKEMYESIGAFDVKLAPAYYEDVDYAIRARRLGYKIMQCQGTAIHRANWSFSKVYSKKQMSEMCQKNRLYVIKKNYRGLERGWRLAVASCVNIMAKAFNVVR